MAFSEKNIPTRNDMLQAMPMNNGFMVEPPAIILDDDGNNVNENHNNVTRDFSVLGAGVNTANIQVKLNAKHEQAELKKKKKQDQENLDRESNVAQSTMDKMFDINGHQFSNADLDETLDDIIDNKDEFQAKHGLTDEEADSALEHAILMKSMSPEERAEYLDDLYKTNPVIADAIADDAENKGIERINRLENTSTASDAKLDQKDTIMAEINEFNDIRQEPSVEDKASSFDLDKPASEISATFTDEVNNVGENARSFALDESPQVAVTERSPATFSLDALS